MKIKKPFILLLFSLIILFGCEIESSCLYQSVHKYMISYHTEIKNYIIRCDDNVDSKGFKKCIITGDVNGLQQTIIAKCDCNGCIPFLEN